MLKLPFLRVQMNTEHKFEMKVEELLFEPGVLCPFQLERRWQL